MKCEAPLKLLVVSTLPWIYPARLACQLRSAGFEVEAACLAGSAIEQACPPIPVHRLNPLREAAGIAAAIKRVEPFLVVPCDDRATGILHRLHASGSAARMRLIERSLGDPAGFAAVRSKRAVLADARGLGLQVPMTTTVSRRTDLEAEVARRGLPLVLKRDGSWGGKGVRIVRTPGELRGAWDELLSRSLAQAVRGVRQHKSLAPVAELFGLSPVDVDVQDYVAGLPANRAVVCEHGRVIAGLSVMALETQSETGAASVVRAVDHPQMAKTAAALVERLGLSGFVGFDFVVSEETGEAVLLEINPRATPISHLAIGGREHLPSEFAEAVTGFPAVGRPKALAGDTIMLFPNEISRDPASGYFATAAHDVPWDQPGLIAMVRRELEQARPGISAKFSTLAGAAS